MAAKLSSCNDRHESGGGPAPLLRQKSLTGDRWSVTLASAPRARAHPSLDAFGPVGKNPAHQNVPYVRSCAASSSILLVTLVCRVLLDVSVAPLLIEVLATRDLLLFLKVRIGSWALVASLFRGHGGHLGHQCSPLDFK